MDGSHNDNILDSYESTENALMDSFKAAALKVTTLYKDSLVQNRKAYAAGYQQALQDLYEFISTQPENGYIPVQDVLQFARQKNSQLTLEMGGHSSSSSASAAAVSPTNTNTNNNNTTTTTNVHSRPIPTTTTTTTTTVDDHYQQQHKLATSTTTTTTATATVMNNPFQIDPYTQFTFTHDVPAAQALRSMDGLWDQATTTIANEGFNKRRLVPNTELSFMGRSMNMENWHEPPFKRGRSRRDEQSQQQQQIQLQQQQQQQQQQQLLLQQQQQIQLQQQQIQLQQQLQQQHQHQHQ